MFCLNVSWSIINTDAKCMRGTYSSFQKMPSNFVHLHPGNCMIKAATTVGSLEHESGKIGMHYELEFGQKVLVQFEYKNPSNGAEKGIFFTHAIFLGIETVKLEHAHLKFPPRTAIVLDCLAFLQKVPLNCLTHMPSLRVLKKWFCDPEDLEMFNYQVFLCVFSCVCFGSYIVVLCRKLLWSTCGDTLYAQGNTRTCIRMKP